MRFAAATLAILALLVAGCGSDDEQQGEPIPARDADALLTQLEIVEDRSDRGICGSANRQIDELEAKVADLPRDIDENVRSELESGLDRLRDLVDEECPGNREPDQTDTTPTETTPTETQPTETQPTETETQPTETEPPPTETTPPPTETTPVPPVPEDDGGVAPPGQNGQAPGRGGNG